MFLNINSFEHGYEQNNSPLQKKAQIYFNHRCTVGVVVPYLSGIRKCSSDQSSLREFCRGVPVIRSLWLDLKSIRVLYNSESSFFSLWASSTPRKAQFMLPNTPCGGREGVHVQCKFTANGIKLLFIKTTALLPQTLSFSRIS